MKHPSPQPSADPRRADPDPRLVRIPPRHISTLLAIVVTALVALHLAGLIFVFALGHSRREGWSGAWQRTFNLNLEGNVPTFYAASALLLCALLLAWLGRADPPPGEQWRWFGLAMVFAFLAVDEAAQLHERLSHPVRTAFALPDVFHFAWVLPYGVALLALAAAYAPFLLRLARRPRAYLFLAAVLYGAALPLEMLGGAETAGGGKRSLRYAAISTVEEVCEMAGVVVFAHGLLLLLAARGATLGVASARELPPARPG